MPKLRIYVDASVIGGCFDEEFSEESRALINLAVTGEVVLLVSDVLFDELREAPPSIRELIESIPLRHLEKLNTTPEAERLQQQYLAAGVVGAGSSQDALHVAVATLADASMIVSWNFKHLVHHDKIRGFSAVNLREGYHPISIFSPLEVI